MNWRKLLFWRKPPIFPSKFDPLGQVGYSKTEEFFMENGNKVLNDSDTDTDHHLYKGTVEELYQHFKQRMCDE